MAAGAGRARLGEAPAAAAEGPGLARGDGGAQVRALLPGGDLLGAGVHGVAARTDVGGCLDYTGGGIGGSCCGSSSCCSGGSGGGSCSGSCSSSGSCCCCCSSCGCGGSCRDLAAGARLISKSSHLTDHLVKNPGVVGDPRHPGGGACAREDNVGVGVVVGLPAVARGPVRHDGVVARAGAPLLDQLTVAVAEDVVGCHPGVVVSPKVVT